MLSKIKQANKKARREQRRRNIRASSEETRRKNKIRQKRMRKMIIQGRREELRARREQIGYVARLEAELADES